MKQFDPYGDDDLASELIFDDAIPSIGGTRTTSVLGANPGHKNADWLFKNQEIIVEHKQIEANLPSAESFKNEALKLQKRWIELGKTNLFGIPHNWTEVSGEWLHLYRRPLQQIVKTANRQVRATRKALEWPSGRGILVLSNQSADEISPLGMCSLLQEILEQSFSELTAIVYTPNHYVDNGSDLALASWYPIYRDGGENTPDEIVQFVDEFGGNFQRFLKQKYPGFDPPRQATAGSEEANRMLLARPIRRRR